MTREEAKETLIDVRAYSASLATFDKRREFANHTYAEIANAILTVINQNCGNEIEVTE